VTDNLKDKTVCVIDNNLFISLAETLAADFGTVMYTSPWVSAFPTSAQILIGEGLPNVKRIDSIWSHLDEIDLFVYPDVYSSDEQLYLESIGKRVWGSRRGDELEIQRKHAKTHLKSVGLDIGPYKVVTGTKALRTYLEHHENQFVKISRTRGDAETFFAKTLQQIEPRILEIEHNLGPQKDYMEFICEDKIEAECEIGYDGYCIDGLFPNSAAYGVEAKSRGYLGHFMEYAKMPSQILETNAKIAPTLQQYGYKNFFAMEARIAKDGTPYIIDPCCRAGSPPSELLQILYTNLAEIMWQGASGVLVDPVPAAEWGALLVIHATHAEKNWLPIEYPKAIEKYVKLRSLVMIDGHKYIAPGQPGIGAVVATGSTPEEAQDKCKEYAKQIDGYTVETEPEAFDEIAGEIEKLEKMGITF